MESKRTTPYKQFNIYIEIIDEYYLLGLFIISDPQPDPVGSGSENFGYDEL